MWISKARFRVMRADADRGRALVAQYAQEVEAHRLTRVALEKTREQARALDERLGRMQQHVLHIEKDLQAARKGAWRWTEGNEDASA